jgi:hypothetical protein
MLTTRLSVLSVTGVVSLTTIQTQACGQLKSFVHWLLGYVCSGKDDCSVKLTPFHPQCCG